MTRGERFNSISHLVGAALALAGAVVLVVVPSRGGDACRVVSFSIYVATLFLLYLISTLYHGLPPRRAKRVFVYSITAIPGCTGSGIFSCWPAASANMWRFWSISDGQ